MGICELCYIYMKPISCNGFPEIYAQLEEGVEVQSAMGICALFYICNLFGVVVFHRSMLNWKRGWKFILPWVYVHCAIYETYLVQWFSTDLCSIGGGGGGSICHGYMCIVLYIYETYLVQWFSKHPCSIGGGSGVNLPWVYVHCSIYETYLV